VEKASKIAESKMEELATYKVGTILDYSIEGKTTNEDFEKTVEIIIQTIQEGRNKKIFLLLCLK
jgi:hypothetical protein